jgi:ACR3 family arsenite transporter
VEQIRRILEARQVAIYVVAIVIGALVGLVVSNAGAFEVAINPALAAMLFATFLQVPLAKLGAALGQPRFLGALLVTNFIVMPAVVAVLVQFLPDDPMLRLGVLLVLLTPCIDYVVTFTQLGQGDARLLLAATPVLLLVQMGLLPVYLRVLLGGDAAGLVATAPFIHAFLWLIAIPFVLAAGLQSGARTKTGEKSTATLGLLPVPATALVLFVVMAAVMPQLGTAPEVGLQVVPIYIAFAGVAPLIGWGVGRLFRLDASAGRSIAFSAGTRNSLVVLPLAFAVPGAMPMLPAVIVTQTLVELLSELIYIRLIPKLGAHRES